MVLWYLPGFYPFSDPSPGTHPGPSLVLTQISIFLILARIPPFPVLARTFLGYSPGFHLSLVLAQISTFRHSPGPFSDTRSDPTFPGTRLNPSLVLAQISTFLGYSPGFHLSLVLAQISTFRHSPGPFSYTSSDPTFLGTRMDPSLVLAQISIFLALARISTFLELVRIPIFRHSPRFYPFLVLAWTLLWYSPRFLFFRHSPGFYPFPVLARTFLCYSSGFHLSLVLAQISTFPELARILPFPVLA